VSQAISTTWYDLDMNIEMKLRWLFCVQIILIIIAIAIDRLTEGFDGLVAIYPAIVAIIICPIIIILGWPLVRNTQRTPLLLKIAVGFNILIPTVIFAVIVIQNILYPT
jgi:hypothetical protein